MESYKRKYIGKKNEIQRYFISCVPALLDAQLPLPVIAMYGLQTVPRICSVQLENSINRCSNFMIINFILWNSTSSGRGISMQQQNSICCMKRKHIV